MSIDIDPADPGEDLEEANNGRVNYRKTPWPWFGGKADAAEIVWRLLGDVPHYVEPFFGSGAVLLRRPHPCNRAYFSETVNDLDGFVCNAWRAIQYHPEEVARHASWPVTEFDKNARQIAVLRWKNERMSELLAGSAEFCDPRIAGWWIWGTCVQIGAFDGSGAWTADPVTGRIVKLGKPGVRKNLPRLAAAAGATRIRAPGVARNLPHLADDGKGVNTAATRAPGVARDLPLLTNNGQGATHPSTREPGVLSDSHANEFHPMTMPELTRWMQWLSARLRHVRILNGDWSRLVTTGAAWSLPVRQGKGPAGVFLDPPYSLEAGRDMGLYAQESGTVAHDVRAWCLANGDNPKFRVVLAGYDTEHADLEAHGWTVHEWFRSGFLKGGMANIGKAGGNGTQQRRERLWASPHCLAIEDKPEAQISLI
jgi:hypothetical protein